MDENMVGYYQVDEGGISFFFILKDEAEDFDECKPKYSYPYPSNVGHNLLPNGFVLAAADEGYNQSVSFGEDPSIFDYIHQYNAVEDAIEVLEKAGWRRSKFFT